MSPIQGLTSNPAQTMTVVLPSGTSFNMTIAFDPAQLGWFITNLTYLPGSFVLTGRRICNSPNMLMAYTNQIPFGLACFTSSNREPTLLQDFSSGASTLYLLSAAECTQWIAMLKRG